MSIIYFSRTVGIVFSNTWWCFYFQATPGDGCEARGTYSWPFFFSQEHYSLLLVFSKQHYALMTFGSFFRKNKNKKHKIVNILPEFTKLNWKNIINYLTFWNLKIWLQLLNLK